MTNLLTLRSFVVSTPDYYLLWPPNGVAVMAPDSEVHLIEADEYRRWEAYRATKNPVNQHQFMAVCGKGLDVDPDRVEPLEEYAQSAVPEKLAKFDSLLDKTPSKLDVLSLMLEEQKSLCDRCQSGAGQVLVEWNQEVLGSIEFEFP